MRQKVNLVCDKCAGPVWRDVEFDQHIELSCLMCGKLWFVQKDILQRVVDRKTLENYYANKRSVIVS